MLRQPVYSKYILCIWKLKPYYPNVAFFVRSMIVINVAIAFSVYNLYMKLLLMSTFYDL